MHLKGDSHQSGFAGNPWSGVPTKRYQGFRTTNPGGSRRKRTQPQTPGFPWYQGFVANPGVPPDPGVRSQTPKDANPGVRHWCELPLSTIAASSHFTLSIRGGPGQGQRLSLQRYSLARGRACMAHLHLHVCTGTVLYSTQARRGWNAEFGVRASLQLIW